MKCDKKAFIKWLRLVSDNCTKVDYDQFHYVLGGMKIVFREMLSLTALDQQLTEFEKRFKDGNVELLNIIIDDINQNWDFYVDQVMNKLIEGEEINGT
jgi:hypothetical protein